MIIRKIFVLSNGEFIGVQDGLRKTDEDDLVCYTAIVIRVKEGYHITTVAEKGSRSQGVLQILKVSNMAVSKEHIIYTIDTNTNVWSDI